MRPTGARLARAGLLVPPLAFLAVFFAWPVVSILDLGLRPGGRGDLSAFREVAGDPALRGVLWFTTWQAALSTAATVVVALPAAHVLGRYEFRGRAAVRTLVAVPFVLPTVVVGAAFLALLGPGSPLGIDLDDTVVAIVVAHVFFNLAVVVRLVGGLWESLDPRTEEAARMLGAGRWRAFASVTLPALRPAVVSAAAIVFLFTFTSFGVVRILGGPGHSTLEAEIYRQTADLFDLPVAAVLCLVQLVAVAVLLVVQDRLDRRRVALQLRPPERSRPRRAGERAWVGLNLAVLVVLVVTPLAVLVERSLRVGDGYGLGSWRALAHAGRGAGPAVPPLEAVAASLRFAVLAAAVAVALGLLAAVALSRTRGRGGRFLDAALLLPLGTSAVTIGFGFLVALDEPPLDLRNEPVLIPLAQAVVALPFVVRTVLPTLRAIDPGLREAAAVLGASPRRAWVEVDLRMTARAVLVGAGFAFAISLGEFGATTVIARSGAPTVPVAIDRLLGRPGALNVGQAFALSTVLMALTATTVVLVDRVRGVRASLL